MRLVKFLLVLLNSSSSKDTLVERVWHVQAPVSRACCSLTPDHVFSRPLSDFLSISFARKDFFESSLSVVFEGYHNVACGCTHGSDGSGISTTLSTWMNYVGCTSSFEIILGFRGFRVAATHLAKLRRKAIGRAARSKFAR